MVTKGVRAAFAEHEPALKQPESTTETEQMRQQLKDMQQMIEQMNVAQQKKTQQQQQMTPAQHLFYQTPYQPQPFFVQPNMHDSNGYQYPTWNNNSFRGNRSRRGGRGRRGHGGQGGQGKGQREHKYCWTHGIGGHNGRECNYPAQGHQQEATLENCMGGNIRGCHT